MEAVATRAYPADWAKYPPLQVPPPALSALISYGCHTSSVDDVVLADSSKTYAVSPAAGMLSQLVRVLPFAVVVGGMMIVDPDGVVHEIELPMVYRKSIDESVIATTSPPGVDMPRRSLLTTQLDQVVGSVKKTLLLRDHAHQAAANDGEQHEHDQKLDECEPGTPSLTH
jgi:hypothetical protein